ncbi:hypothetical protein Tco_1109947 [Tanacetum coccineum]|uniref:Uncharacterized protein n=1 Tax=Tanacetum coccineum TaxID=301880 RepID=A0ABQ5IJU8_9ASTR
MSSMSCRHSLLKSPSLYIASDHLDELQSLPGSELESLPASCFLNQPACMTGLLHGPQTWPKDYVEIGKGDLEVLEDSFPFDLIPGGTPHLT